MDFETIEELAQHAALELRRSIAETGAVDR